MGDIGAQVLEFEVGKKHLLVFTIDYNVGPGAIHRAQEMLKESVWPHIDEFLNSDEIANAIVLPNYITLELKKVDPE